MNVTVDRFIRCLLTLTAPAALLSCSRHQPPAMPPPRVTVSQPQVATVTNWDGYPGHLEAVESVEIRPRVSGYIDSIHFTDGAEVKAGDLLFVIDPRPYQAALDQAKAERQRAQARSELDRKRPQARGAFAGYQGDFRGGIRQPQQGRPRGRSRPGRGQGRGSRSATQPRVHRASRPRSTARLAAAW